MKKILVFITICACTFRILAQTDLAKSSSISAIKPIGNTIFFAADDGINGEELWVSDGLTGNARLVKDINPSYNSSFPKNFIAFNGQLFFSATNLEFQTELWKSDGTPDGTQLVSDLTPSSDYYSGSNPQLLTIFKNNLYFTTSSGALYKTDGSTAGTLLVDKINGSTITQLTVLNDYLFYIKSGKLQRTDGNAIIELSLPSKAVNEDMYFRSLYATTSQLIALSTSSSSSTIRLHLFKSTTNNWELLTEIKKTVVYGDQEVDNFRAVGEKLYFSLRTDYDNIAPTDELWSTDGTSGGTLKIKSFTWDPHWYQSEMDHFTAFNGALYFRSGESEKKSLWKSDGTPAGTIKLNDVVLTTPNNATNPPVVSNGKLYFSGNNDLWSTDGTPEGTSRLFDTDELPYLLSEANGIVYYSTGNNYSATHLWSSAPAAQIRISEDGLNSKPNNGFIVFTSILIEDCVKKTITISNEGNQPLILKNVKIIGNDFFLKGELPEVIEPAKKATFDLFFSPTSKGSKTATLLICSNDNSKSEFTLSLSATTLDSDVLGFCQSFSNSFTKTLQPTTLKDLALTGQSIEEFSPVGTVIGRISTPDWNAVSYSLIDGVGSQDNTRFNVDSDELKTKSIFSYNAKRFYTVRIKAINQAGESKEAIFMIEILPKAHLYGGSDCQPIFEELDFGLLSIESNSTGQLFSTTTDGRILRSIDEGKNWDVVTSTGLLYSYGGQLLFKGNTGYALFVNSLLKSEDNGATWFTLYTPFVISSISFIDALSGFASASNGALFYTSDGGKKWETRGNTNFEYLSKMHFWNNSKGIAARGSSTLVKTEDGGKTWATISLSTLGWISQILKLYFIDDNNGFLATDNGFFNTKDGGSTWTKSSASVSGNIIINFTDSTTGYLCYSGLLYKTTNAGNTWQQLTSPQAGTITGLALINSDKIITSHYTGYYSPTRGRSINLSTDGGISWQNLQYLGAESFNSVDFPSQNVGYLVSGSYGYKTLDKGLSWKKLSLPALGSVYFVNETTGLLATAKILYKTTDGGNTFVQVSTISSSPQSTLSFGSIFGVTENLLFSFNSYSNTLHRSIDGGNNWDNLSSGLTSASPGVAMHFISPSIGYYLDLFGIVKKTTNAGSTWQQISVTPTESGVSYQSIFFLNENIGFRGGEQLSKSIDGGVNWKRIYTSLTNIFKLYFTSETNGYAFTRDGKIYKTTDGGIIWNPSIIYSSSDFHAVSIRNSTISVCGEDGFVGHFTSIISRPNQPGYISGATVACKGDLQLYTLSALFPQSTYQWSVTGGAQLEQSGATAKINFVESGAYSISVALKNACGTSEERTFNVKVSDPDVPVISGPVTVALKSSKLRYDVIDPKADFAYNWNATGGTISNKESNTYTTVDWNMAYPDAKVSVVSTSKTSGCRARGDLPVNVDLTTEIVQEDWNTIIVYPNPTESKIIVHTNNSTPLSLTLTDLMGRKILYKEPSRSDKMEFELSGLPAGIYILVLTDPETENTITKKIIRK